MSEYKVSSHMQRYDLHKFHGLSNDFLIWFRPSLPQDAPSYAKQWCDRHTGIGADGLIVAIDDRQASQFLLFNADGSEAEISGNGIRCFAHAIARRRGLDTGEINVQTAVGQRLINIEDALQLTAQATVDMGEPQPGPMVENLDLGIVADATSAHTIDMGNPHIVIETPTALQYDIATVGPHIEAQFPETGINVHLINIDEDKQISMQIWERGAGVTKACGSGACAAAAVASRDSELPTTFKVSMPGGDCSVKVGDTIQLIGPSTYIAALARPESLNNG